jgi:hypothetical protein
MYPYAQVAAREAAEVASAAAAADAYNRAAAGKQACALPLSCSSVNMACCAGC